MGSSMTGLKLEDTSGTNFGSFIRLEVVRACHARFQRPLCDSDNAVVLLCVSVYLSSAYNCGTKRYSAYLK